MIFHHSVPVNFGSVRDSKKVIAFFPSSLAFFAQVFLNFSREEKFFFFFAGLKFWKRALFLFFSSFLRYFPKNMLVLQFLSPGFRTLEILGMKFKKSSPILWKLSRAGRRHGTTKSWAGVVPSPRIPHYRPGFSRIQFPNTIFFSVARTNLARGGWWVANGKGGRVRKRKS